MLKCPTKNIFCFWCDANYNCMLSNDPKELATLCNSYAPTNFLNALIEVIKKCV